jgi:thiol-disulfide isomerase/thioredoxin
MKIIKIGANWCAGCLVMKPRWKEIEKELPWLQTEYYDFDESKKIVEKYSINDKLPVFIFFDKDDNEIIRLQGEIEKNKILEIIEQNKNK